MSFDRLIGAWSTWSKLAGNNDDDWVDRLNHIYTVVILLVFALFVAGGAYVDDPIACFLPHEYSGHQAKYANNYCWIKNTYYVPIGDEIPRDVSDHVDLEVTYYQYVPMILILMASLFKIPSVMWRLFSPYSGIDLNKIVNLTLEANYISDTKRDEKVREIALCIDRWLTANRQYHWNILVRIRQKASRLCLFLNRREGTYLIGLYILTKILFLANVVSQFFILDAFMGGFFGMWGIEAVRSLAHEYRIKESHRFPRVTLCDYKILQLKNIQDVTVQCVLSINLFNEKIFLFIWFWYVLVSVVTGVNLVFWIWRSVFRRNRVIVVKKYLRLKSRLRTETDKKLCRMFATHLRDDGIFLIRMIGKNSNDILVTELVVQLWDIYLEKSFVKRMLETEQNGRQSNGSAAPVVTISNDGHYV